MSRLFQFMRTINESIADCNCFCTFRRRHRTFSGSIMRGLAAVRWRKGTVRYRVSIDSSNGAVYETGRSENKEDRR